VSGVWGRTRIIQLAGTYDASAARSYALRLTAQGEADLGDLRDQALRGLFPAALAKPLLLPQSLEGRTKFNAVLTRAGGPSRAEGRLDFDDVRLQWDKFAFTNVNGSIALAPEEIKTDNVHALISGSPVTIRAALKNYMEEDGLFDLTAESTGLRAGIVSLLLLEKGSMQDPGIVRGSVRYQGSFNDKRQRRLTGDLELIKVQLAVEPLLQPLRQLSGKIAIDENGIEFDNMKGLLLGMPASASGRWYYGRTPQLVFVFAADNLDINYLISQIDPAGTDFYNSLQAEGRVVLGKTRIRNLELMDLRTKLILDRRLWRFPDFTAHVDGGVVSGPIVVMHQRDTLGMDVQGRIQNTPLATIMRWLDIPNSEITGVTDLAGKFATVGKDDAERKRSLNGAFTLKITNGTIHRLRILVQLLNVLDLSRWFTLQLPDLSKQGIRFRAITGDFKVDDGVFHTENLLVDSDDLRITGAGKIDLPNGDMDFLVAVRPFPGIDAAITHIPLLGRGIAAIKNSFLVASFNIKGPIDDPTITPAPLSTLSEMVWSLLKVPKSLVPFSGDEVGPAAGLPKEPARELTP
jgi:hypothetical protein